MGEWQLFEPGTIPECTTPEWYRTRDRAPHLEQDLHRGRLELAAHHVRVVAESRELTTVVDLGAGDGGLLALLCADTWGDRWHQWNPDDAWGYDLQPTNIAGAAERGVNVELGDSVTGPIRWGDISVATEMLEHLVDPQGFLKTVAANARAVIASSPWTETDVAHYEHHVWAWDHAGYRALLEQAGFEVVRHETVNMFQVITGVRP